jgi:hypothetical protein
MGFGLYGSLHSPQWFDLQVHRQRVLRLSTFFNGLGIKLFDGLPAIPACCRASGNGNREDTGKGFLCDARITEAMLYGSKGCAAGQSSMGRVTTHSRRSTFATKCPRYVANRTLVSYVATRFTKFVALRDDKDPRKKIASAAGQPARPAVMRHKGYCQTGHSDG